MTTQEAINYMKSAQGFLKHVGFGEAFDMAIAALKKQEAKKPKYEEEPYPKHMNEGAKAPYCPICYQDLLDENNDCFTFCPGCGQAVDWS